MPYVGQWIEAVNVAYGKTIPHQYIFIRLHGCPLKDEFLFVKAVLTEEEEFLHKKNRVGPGQWFAIPEQVIRE